MKTSDFDYHLPPELIAQEPLSNRDASKLLRMSRKNGQIEHLRFADFASFIEPGDRLIFNNTRVIPARVYCTKDTGARIEFLFTRQISERTWQALAKPRKRLRTGMLLSLENHPTHFLHVQEMPDSGETIISLPHDSPWETLLAMMQECGEMPLPHYIRRDVRKDDDQRYQTVFAQVPGAIAAPTAGLHFTQDILDALQKKGVDRSFVTLNVGVGTFKPVEVDDPEEHPMHEEFFELSKKTVDEIELTRKEGGRIIAVGTTVVRTLEHCSLSGQLIAQKGSTRMLILPGHTFQIVQGLLTNFHLPKSTLLMLVSAFAGREHIMNAYHEAITQKYRFFSYGDAMLLV